MGTSLALNRCYSVIGVWGWAETFAVNQRRNGHRATPILPIVFGATPHISFPDRSGGKIIEFS
jgi:hypothetical protein